jgi:outer membrane lipoprotein-sorting protein
MGCVASLAACLGGLTRAVLAEPAPLSSGDGAPDDAARPVSPSATPGAPGAAGGAESSADLDALLASLAAVPGVSARFREEKQIALLDAPLISEGTLHFAPPDRLAREQTQPERSRVVLAGTTMWIATDLEAQRIDLVSQPLVGAVVASFRALLAGDRAALASLYEIALTRDGEAWTVVLAPRDTALRRAIERVEIRGRSAVVEALRVQDASGDTTTLRFHDVDTTRRFSPAELDALFRMPS